jgi:N-methylhydantoinase A
VGSVSFRLGVDVGGTFTDLVLLGDDGSVRTLKLPSTPPDFDRAVVAGLAELLRNNDLAPADVTHVRHGTTVATNAILQATGARTALVTTTGFRDVLEIGRMRHPSLFDIDWIRPPTLVPRRHRYEIDLRINARGEVVRHPKPADVKTLTTALTAAEVESIAVVLLNSYANPAAEIQFANQLRAALPGISFSVSAELAPQIKEYERTSTTVVNAYVKPTVERYVGRLESGLRELGVPARLMVMQSNGGLLDAKDCCASPVRLIESGPAAGVIASVALAQQISTSSLIAFDMGGTTAKASLVEDGHAQMSAQYEVGGGMSTRHGLMRGNGYTIAVPSIDIAEVGAGGGSICWVDSGGAPRIGPQSAGAIPGPACYGRGGELPTLTDAAAVLGYLSPVSLAGGQQRIDIDLARTALDRHFATPLGLSLEEAAFGAYKLAVTTMSKAVKAVTTSRGRDPRLFSLEAFGGAGPAYVVEMARDFGIPTVLVPQNPGLFSAVGVLEAEVSQDFTVSPRERSLVDPTPLKEAAQELAARAAESMDLKGVELGHMELAFGLGVRYRGQSSELMVDCRLEEFTTSGLSELVERFEMDHEKTYGHRGVTSDVEFVNVRARVIKADPDRGRYRALARQSPSVTRDPACRRAYFGPRYGYVDTPVLERGHLSSTPLDGPLIVEDMDATTLVPPAASAGIDDFGNLVIGVGP